jgi:hypothetical protein
MAINSVFVFGTLIDGTKRRYYLPILILIGCQFFGCTSDVDPKNRVANSSIDIISLLIDESVFPSNWHAGSDGPQIPANAPLGGYESIERISLDFFSDIGSGVAAEDIHQFLTSSDAREEYTHQLDAWFPTGEYWSDWETLGEGYLSNYRANQIFIACAKKGVDPEQGRERCHMIGQYNQYFVRFSAHIFSNLNHKEFLGIIQAIDDQMALVIP